MNVTKHFDVRMNQRGQTGPLVDLVLRYGEIQGDRAVIGRRLANRLIDQVKRQLRDARRTANSGSAIVATLANGLAEELESELNVLKKIADKGGVVVVEENNQLLTTYNFSN